MAIIASRVTAIGSLAAHSDRKRLSDNGPYAAPYTGQLALYDPLMSYIEDANSDSDAARNVREAQAVLMFVAVLAACPAARIPIKHEVFAGVAELGDAFAGHLSRL